MLKETRGTNSAAEAKTSHRCSLLCLGPLTFHPNAVGHKVTLSQGCRLAERKGTTFRDGLVFSSCQLRIRERICLRVVKHVSNWHGALRVGFTNVPPSSRSLPHFVIPNLTNRPGYWAAPVNESFCQTGAELEFWVSRGGTIWVANNNGRKVKVLVGVDLSQPLWAMIDLYGQTCSLLLLGSKKKGLLYTRRSCPAPEHLCPPANTDECTSCLDTDIPAGGATDCVVCMEREARVTLPCGHRCLCQNCVNRIVLEFGTCPLCRWRIRDGYDLLTGFS